MKVELVVKKPYIESGPRGGDVYAHRLEEALRRQKNIDVIVSYDVPTYKGDVIHYTFFDLFFETLQVSKREPCLVTVHDLIPRRFPRHFPAGIRGSLRWLKQRKALQKVQAVITDSRASKDDLVTFAGVRKDSIYPIFLGPNIENGNSSTADVNKKYNLPSRYILYVGDINWNKNVPGLIDAFGRIDSNIHLVLAGKAFLSPQEIPELAAIRQAIENCPARERIITPGFIEDSDMKKVYGQAMLYIQPSWYEGFGLPVLEAMRVGCPVVTSNKGSLPELGADCVHYFDPEDKEGFVRILEELLVNAKKRNHLIDRAKKRAETFTWDQTARKTIEVYEKVRAESH